MPERATGQKVDVLLHAIQLIARQFPQQRAVLRSKCFRDRIIEVSLRQKLEFGGPCLGDEIGDVARLIIEFEILMSDVVILLVAEARNLLAQHLSVGGGGIAGVGQLPEHLPRHRHFAARICLALDMEQYGVAQRATQPPAGEDIVADTRDAMRAEIFARHPHDGIADGCRHPTVDAVTNDVIEQTIARGQIRDRLMAQFDVVQPKFGYSRPALGNLDGR